MAIETVRDFLTLLGESRLLTVTQMKQLDQRPAAPLDARHLARELVDAGLITAFQADQLLCGERGPFHLGAYEILGALGKGGMGQVFKARHRVLDRLAAVKVIRANLLTSPDSVKRFHREARAAAALKHPNVVAVYDANECDGVHYIAMEYVEGCDLSRMVKRGSPLPVGRACEYVRQAALGLQHAHEHGVIHRDVKPSNLILVGPGHADCGLVKVLDFGLARLGGDPADDSPLTQTDQWLGTPDYVAPEQALSSKSVDVRCDVFSLGCTLFYLLTGQGAYEGDTPAQRLAARLSGRPQSLLLLCPQAPAELEPIVARLLARDPAKRFQTPGEVATALAPFAHIDPGAPAVPPPDSSEPTGLFAPPAPPDTARRDKTQTWPGPPRPRRWPLVLGAVAVACLAVASLVWFWPRTPPVVDGGPAEDKKGIAHSLGAVEDNKLVTNSIGMKLVLIPAGRFQMGSPQDEAGRMDDEGPRHEAVIAAAFYLGAYEVTQGDYERVTGKSPSHFGPKGAGSLAPRGVDVARLPVESVSWEDAIAFCATLSALPAERAAGRTYRLPSEAEWEYACRAGTTTPFAFGTSLGAAQANANGALPYGGAPRGENVPHPVAVGSYAPNAWGLYDMHGNVWEWTADRPHKYGSREAPPAAARPDRVLRGGSWFFAAAACRSARRFAQGPQQNSSYYGFRVACDVAAPK